ncbi:MAG: autotransporter-associated beta strand repeat-containing protein, partial [Kiritimatiellae bacterium]|nr:autotransporter-associated beta strand repeat-containing protein [Kiritimatiellia bacterium]
MVQLEYFYDNGNVGELHLHVPAGVTNTNSTVSFTGNIKLVKEGEGTFTAAKTGQQYSGGTDILGGTVKCATGAQDQLLGVQLSQILVASGAVLDVCNCTRAYSYKVISDGGTLTNSGSGLGSGATQLGSLTLTADSVLDSTHSLGFVNVSYAPTLLDLGGHTLDVNTGGEGIFRMTNCDATNGTVRVTTTGAGIMSFVNGEVRAPTVDFDLSCRVNPASPTTVRNLLLRAPCAALANTQTISVFGRFKTETLDFPDVRLEDGSTLDLSGQEGALSTAGSSTHASQYYLTFSPNATIAVDVGARSVAVGDCLVSWPAGRVPASSVKFVLCANGEPVEGKSLAVVESDDRHGIYVKESGTPDYATWDNGWKFYTQDGDEVSGWAGGVTANMQVRFSTAAEYTALCNADAVTPSAFVLAADALTIPAGTTADLDGTVSFSINEGTVFDVNGGRLKLPASLSEGVKAFTVTNSAEQVGTLEIAVAEGESCVNSAMALTGNLKFLKTGAGTFTVSKPGQTYSGGTAVEGGVLASGLNGTANPFGTGAITVSAGGTFDFNGQRDFYSYQMTLDGGTIRNTGADLGGNTAQVGSLAVTADGSRFEARKNIGLLNHDHGQTLLDLRGHTLTVDIAAGKSFWLYNTVVSNGTLDVTGAGTLDMDKTAIVATNASFR